MGGEFVADKPGKDELVAISVESRKGGVGKTTLAMYLARYLLQKNWEVLFLDLDIGGTSAGYVAESLSSHGASVWKQALHVVRALKEPVEPGGRALGRPAAEKTAPMNLVDAFERYMSGYEDLNSLSWEDDPSLAKAKGMGLARGRINLFPSYLGRQDDQAEGKDRIYHPAVLFDEMHARWFLLMVKDLVNTAWKRLSQHAGAEAPRGRLAVVIDNSPGYSGFSPQVEEWLTDLGPRQGKFLFVSTLDSQDLGAVWGSLSAVHGLVLDKWRASRDLCRILDKGEMTPPMQESPGRQDRFFTRLCELGPESREGHAKCGKETGHKDCTECQLCYYRQPGGDLGEPPDPWKRYLSVIVNKSSISETSDRVYDYAGVYCGLLAGGLEDKEARDRHPLRLLWPDKIDGKTDGRDEAEQADSVLYEYIEGEGRIVPFMLAFVSQFTMAALRELPAALDGPRIEEGAYEPAPGGRQTLAEAQRAFEALEAPPLDPSQENERDRAREAVAHGAWGLAIAFDEQVTAEVLRQAEPSQKEQARELAGELSLLANLRESLRDFLDNAGRAMDAPALRRLPTEDELSKIRKAAVEAYYRVLAEEVASNLAGRGSLDIKTVNGLSPAFAGLLALAAGGEDYDRLAADRLEERARAAAWLTVVAARELADLKKGPDGPKPGAPPWEALGADRERARLAVEAVGVYNGADKCFKEQGGRVKFREWYQVFCRAAAGLHDLEYKFRDLTRVCRLLLLPQTRVNVSVKFLRAYARWLVRSDQEVGAVWEDLQRAFMEGVGLAVRGEISFEDIQDWVLLNPATNPFSGVVERVAEKDWVLPSEPEATP